MEREPVTHAYRDDRHRLVGILNQALATEWACVLHSERPYMARSGATAPAVPAEFFQHVEEAQVLDDRTAVRITHLRDRRMTHFRVDSGFSVPDA